jgi:hypothetical protein
VGGFPRDVTFRSCGFHGRALTKLAVLSLGAVSFFAVGPISDA